MTAQKALLLILDGWGIRRAKKGNAIALAKTPVFDSLWKKSPRSVLKACGKSVGLPKGFMGNSEVGHLTIGTGRVVPSDFERINNSIRDGSFFSNKVLVRAMKNACKRGRSLHLMGLLSDGGVHSHINHLFALLDLAKQRGVTRVFVHAFLDGRDTQPKSAAKFVRKLKNKMRTLGVGELATMIGRFYAMDRDNRWKREQKAYECIVNCVGRKRSDPYKALEEAYTQGESDEYFKPTIISSGCVVKPNDSVVFFNFRSDRARELTRAFVCSEFSEFARTTCLELEFVTLTQYDSLVQTPVAFPPRSITKTLGEVISAKGLRQLRLAETEKWAHVTYFFNGLCECIFTREKRIKVPSLKIKRYNNKPEMKVRAITKRLLERAREFDFFVVNFANADMVGHTGDIAAARKGVEAIDKGLGKIIAQFPGTIFITADHGNCENMLGGKETSHTLSNVPFIVTGNSKVSALRKKGGLYDVAPTILDVMGIAKPKEMTGKSLLR